MWSLLSKDRSNKLNNIGETSGLFWNFGNGGVYLCKQIEEMLVENIKKLLEEGFSVSEIGTKVGKDPRRISDIIKKESLLGTGIGYIKKVNHDFFNKINSEIKAYLLGYLLADGCVLIEPKKKNGLIYSYSKRIAFTVAIDDLYCLELFKKHVSPDSIIFQKHNSKGAVCRKMSCRLRINSKTIVDILINKYSILPNKTKDVEFKFDFSNIPQNLHRHFIRGFFDGDGWVTNVTSIFAKNSKIGFVSTSKNFLIQLGDILSNSLDCNYNIYVDKSCFILNLSVEGRSNIKSEVLTKNILNYLYKDSNYFLERKFKKFKFQDKYTGNTEITCKIKKLQAS